MNSTIKSGDHAEIDGSIALLDIGENFRTHRMLLIVASIGLFSPVFISWSSIIQLPVVGAMAIASCIATFALVLTAVTSRTDEMLVRLDYLVLALALLVLAMWAITDLYFYPVYGTDEAAFVQYAAQLLMHGHDPYTHNLLPALTKFRVPIQFATYKLNGTFVSSLEYPALSFLLVIPAILLTHGVQAIISENILFLGIEMVLLFAFLPRAYRALGVVVVVGLPFLFQNSIGGVIVTISVPFMLVVAYRWTDIGRSGFLRRQGILSAVCLGLAASVSQFSWFVAPFLIVALWHLRDNDLGRRKASAVLFRFISIAGGTFLIVNAPFIVWSPRAWSSGVFSPLVQHAIPFGQGLIDATTFFHLGGGNLSYYTYASVLCILALLIFSSTYFDRLWKATFIFPSVAFLFSTRSLDEYFGMMVAMWVVSTLSPGGGLTREVTALPSLDSPSDRKPRRWNRRSRHRIGARVVVLCASVAAVFVCFGLAIATPAPIRIKIESVETNGQFRSIWLIKALVTNRSDASVTPHFATDASGYMTTFWNSTAGPKILRSGESALYTLVAPNIGSMPGVTQPFLLQAVSDSPESMSSSALFTPEPFDSSISPSFVDRIIPLGKVISLQVELRSPYGAPVKQGKIRIALGQVIYAQNALIPGEAEINGAPEGQSPVIALTNGNGIAKFRVSDSSDQGGNPLYFQAYVDPVNGFPYGYSEVVSVQWASSNTKLSQ
jgi:uncharacterized membrane protein